MCDHAGHGVTARRGRFRQGVVQRTERVGGLRFEHRLGDALAGEAHRKLGHGSNLGVVLGPGTIVVVTSAVADAPTPDAEAPMPKCPMPK